ncbi:hypothetical protein jhhlp_004337 [Lomentospora prolificans]|uniref:RNase III domain-containing protein n=1 Tax=Lomentospora prolificans TaxID=41688 RepID=A0A2N3NB97_9PEZI|nr:hypothetical protein jhhlp_004337 [Lomentospora prolificans]
MTKRSHNQISDGHIRQAEGDSKRRRSETGLESREDAVSLIRAHSSSLIECLQALNSSTSNRADENLVSLSKKLLPAIQALAGEAAETTAAQHQDAKPQPTLGEQAQKPDAPSSRGLEFFDSALVTPWTTKDISPSLPPLPSAYPELAEAAFRSPAVAKPGEMSYDRLEWIGDANLYLLSSYLIFFTFGGLDAGKGSQLRERLVRNQTLASYFRDYNLVQRAKLPPNLDLKSKEGQKVQGDMIEAYVGAIVLSDKKQGATKAAAWLKALWARTIAEEIRKVEKNPETHRVQELGQVREVDEAATAKQRLNLALKVPGVDLIFEDVPTKQKNKHNGQPMFTVNLFLKGWGEQKKLLGWGTAGSKNEARQKAALMALANKKVLSVYEAKKKAYLLARDAAGGEGTSKTK